MKKIMILVIILFLAIVLFHVFTSSKILKPEAITRATPKLAEYIPKDINDFIESTKKVVPINHLQGLKLSKEDDIVSGYERGKKDLQNYLGLNNNSRFAKYFMGLGISKPEDMATIAFLSLHRSLNDKSLEFEKLVTLYKESN